MVVCAGIKRNGGRCTVEVGPSQTHCYQHDPDRASERRRNAARGGRGKASKEVRDLKLEVRDLIADVRSGSLERNDAGAMIQGYRVLKDLIEVERRIKEQEEVLARLYALETRQNLQRPGPGRARWDG